MVSRGRKVVGIEKNPLTLGKIALQNEEILGNSLKLLVFLKTGLVFRSFSLVFRFRPSFLEPGEVLT
jgi:hypothetical protein